VDDVVAGPEVLELGEEGPAHGPADDDLLLGEDVLLGEEVELLLRIAEAAGERAEEEGDLVAGRDREGRAGLDDGDVVLAQERRQALARPGIVEVDRAEVALGLELLQVLEEERDLVVEAGRGLEGEGEDLLAGRGAQVLEADGFLADTLEETGREDGVGIEGEDAAGEEVGALVAELLEVLVPLAVDGLGIVDDEDGIREVVGHRDEAVGEDEGQGGEAQAEVAAVERGDLGVEVAGEALGAAAGGGLPGVEEFGGGRELAQARYRQSVDPLERALGGDIEFPERRDARPVELDAVGIRLPGREDVDDAAAPGEFAGRGDEVLAGVAEAGQGLEEGVVVGLVPHLEGEEETAHVVGRGDRLEQAAERGDDERGRAREEPVEEPHPRRHGVEGGRDFEVGVLGKRGQGGQAELGSEAGEEEPAVLLGLGERSGLGADEDDGPAGGLGQAGQKIGLSGLDDAVDGEGPAGRGDGPDEVGELGRAEEEIEAHRSILTAVCRGVKPRFPLFGL
jgi:hypothetical protein